MTAAEALVDGPWITEPGRYEMTAEQYHRDPVVGGSLSSTGMRKLLPPSCPAKFKAYIEGKRFEESDALDFGKATHARVLGVGDPVEVMSMRDGRTKDGKADAVRKSALVADGYTVISPAQDEAITAMATAIREHPIAGALLEPGTGDAEQVLVWRDEFTGVMCRAMIDWLPHVYAGERLIVCDFKTTKSAEPNEIEKSIWTFGYQMQGEHYLDGVRELGLAGDLEPAFVFIFQEKTPPYVVTVVQYDADAADWGRRQNATARRIYRECSETGHWPGYSDDIVSAQLPGYATYQLKAMAETGRLDDPFGEVPR